jgi:hypothetical protein
MKHKPTDEQQAILDEAAKDGPSLMINAYAGCAKTTSLEMAASVMSPKPSLAVAFNKKIAKELEQRFPGNFQCVTLNGLGHRAWGRALGRQLTLEDKKLGKLVTSESKASGANLTSDQWQAVRELTSKAMQLGLTPAGTRPGLVEDTPENWLDIAEANWVELGRDSEMLVGLARKVLRKNVDLAMDGVVSFDDQVYMSALFGGVFPRFGQVVVDEAQDLSPLNHMQIAKVAGPDGRYFVCGDNKQAIYAFRGADSSSMKSLRRLRQDWIDRPLATTFRCPRAIVARQQMHAPGFTAAAQAPEGVIASWPRPQAEGVTEPRGWGVVDMAEMYPKGYGASPLAVLCRNNAPLLGLAFKLIRQGVGVHMLGRDIGKGLTALLRKLCPEGERTADYAIGLIREWQSSERSKALANEDDAKAEGVDDRAECLLAVADADGVRTAEDMQKRLEQLFSRESGAVVLSTGHRAKGLEYDTVIHLDPWRVPSKYGKMRGGKVLEQELNLRYVIETRTKRTLVEANLEDFSS